MFIDLLVPCAIFSKVMQRDEVDILCAMTSMIKTVKEINKLGTLPLDRWPTYAATLKKIMLEDSEYVYQCQAIKSFNEAKTMLTSKHKDYCSSITECLKSRLKWSDLDLIRDMIYILETQGWQKIMDEQESQSELPDEIEAVVRVGDKFKTPLENAGVNINELCREFMDMVDHATQFISLSTLNYLEVWWKIFHSPNASKWSNILTLVQLLLSLPASNGKLERIFSSMKVIKGDRRCSLNNDTLDDLLVLNSDKVPLTQFNPDKSIDLWWAAKTRRPNQSSRKEYTRHQSSGPSTSTDESDATSPENIVLLDDWDNWLAPDETDSNSDDY